jgi:hypothetical protein
VVFISKYNCLIITFISLFSNFHKKIHVYKGRFKFYPCNYDNKETTIKDNNYVNKTLMSKFDYNKQLINKYE